MSEGKGNSLLAGCGNDAEAAVCMNCSIRSLLAFIFYSRVSVHTPKGTVRRRLRQSLQLLETNERR